MYMYFGKLIVSSFGIKEHSVAVSFKKTPIGLSRCWFSYRDVLIGRVTHVILHFATGVSMTVAIDCMSKQNNGTLGQRGEEENFEEARPKSSLALMYGRKSGPAMVVPSATAFWPVLVHGKKFSKIRK